MESRPIHELIKLQRFWPCAEGAVPHDRRGQGRFRGKVPAVLVSKRINYTVDCVDISLSGVLLMSQCPVRLAAEEKVLVKVRFGGRNFRDRYAVVKVSSSRGLWCIHLRLEASQQPV